MLIGKKLTQLYKNAKKRQEQLRIEKRFNELKNCVNGTKDQSLEN